MLIYNEMCPRGDSTSTHTPCGASIALLSADRTGRDPQPRRQNRSGRLSRTAGQRAPHDRPSNFGAWTHCARSGPWTMPPPSPRTWSQHALACRTSGGTRSSSYSTTTPACYATTGLRPRRRCGRPAHALPETAASTRPSPLLASTSPAVTAGPPQPGCAIPILRRCHVVRHRTTRPTPPRPGRITAVLPQTRHLHHQRRREATLRRHN
jgi:hypothetical protein